MIAGHQFISLATISVLTITQTWWTLLRKYDVCLNVISKSGTTTEPAIAFRLFKQLIEKKYGVDGAKDRIVVTTNSDKGTLNDPGDRARLSKVYYSG